MTLQELHEAASAGMVDGLEVVSLEGGFYIVQVRRANSLKLLCDESGQVLHLRSTTQARTLLAGLWPLPCELIQHCVHDEMGATRETSVQPLRIPLSLEPSS
ncbi:DUF6482 family protein [Pseudomonas sp. NY15181]|uniref:DUF6482 family protein n=1 Tax=Pseudomonas sp. NY15181 TaxID=3400349 RepID=UPI003A89913E